MSRLIDADDFRRILREIQTDAEHFDNVQRKNDIGSIIALLDKQPTAFDTEKVVEQLMIIHDEGYCPNEDGFECILDKACSDCYREKIIDIVKKGGVE